MEPFTLIMGAMGVLKEIIAYINKQIEIAKQNNELTVEQERTIRNSQEDTMATASWWKRSDATE